MDFSTVSDVAVVVGVHGVAIFVDSKQTDVKGSVEMSTVGLTVIVVFYC